MIKNIYLIVSLWIWGFTAFGQSYDSVYKHSTRKFWIKQSIAPAALITAGLYTLDEDHLINRFQVRDYRNEKYPNFSHHLDNYLQHVPIITVYALNAIGIKGKNEWQNRTALLIKSELILSAIVYPLKQLTHQLRPDSSNYHSFPSGHTAQAFMAATFLHKEFGSRSVWYSIAGYTMATTVGVFRILNNKHWISDVLVGAGIGIFSTNVAYATHKYKWGKKGTSLSITPIYMNGPGLYACLSFR